MESEQDPNMPTAPDKTDRWQDQRTSVALLAIMLVMAGMTAGAIEQVAARAVESVHRDCRLVDGATGRAATSLHSVHCESRAGNLQVELLPALSTLDADHFPGTGRDLERRRHNLPPPTFA